MEIKEVYLDLKEWPQYAKKNKSVFKLESEAFKEPLKFKFVYDDSDLNNLRLQVKNLENKLASKEKDIDFLMKSIEKLTYELKWLNNRYDKYEEYHLLIDEILSEIKTNQNKQEKVSDKLNEYYIHLNTQLTDTAKYIARLENLIAERWAKMYEQTEFISWNGVYYYNTVPISSWEYLVIQTTTIDESNEYVLNRDSTEYFKVSIDDKWYTPFYQLKATTPLDKPTATVKLTILFFPM